MKPGDFDGSPELATLKMLRDQLDVAIHLLETGQVQDTNPPSIHSPISTLDLFDVVIGHFGIVNIEARQRWKMAVNVINHYDVPHIGYPPPETEFFLIDVLIDSVKISAVKIPWSERAASKQQIEALVRADPKVKAALQLTNLRLVHMWGGTPPEYIDFINVK